MCTYDSKWFFGILHCKLLCQFDGRHCKKIKTVVYIFLWKHCITTCYFFQLISFPYIICSSHIKADGACIPNEFHFNEWTNVFFLNHLDNERWTICLVQHMKWDHFYLYCGLPYPQQDELLGTNIYGNWNVCNVSCDTKTITLTEKPLKLVWVLSYSPTALWSEHTLEIVWWKPDIIKKKILSPN